MASDYIVKQRAEFWKTKRELEALDAKKATLETQRDAIQDEADAKIRPINDQIRPLIAERAELQQRQNFLTQGLGRKVGEDPDAPKAAAA